MTRTERNLAKHRPEWKGLPISDAREDVIVSVRQKDVDNANRKDPDSCAIVLACERRGWDAIVYLTSIYIRMGDNILRFQSSGELRHELRIFDETDQFMPGPYVLKAVPKGDRLGSAKQRKGLYRVPSRKRRPVSLTVRRFE